MNNGPFKWVPFFQDGVKLICPEEDGAPIRDYNDNGSGKFLYGIHNFIGDKCVTRPGLFLDVDGKILKNLPNHIIHEYDIIHDRVESEFGLESEQIYEIIHRTIEGFRMPNKCEIDNDCPPHLVSI